MVEIKSFYTCTVGGHEPEKAKLKGVSAAASEPSQVSENEDTSRVAMGLASHSSQASSKHDIMLLSLCML